MLAGVDEGLPYRVDILPVTVHAEIEALRAGRRTYAVNGDYVTHRNAVRMKGDAVRGRPAVLATHDCHAIVRPEFLDETAVKEVQRIVSMASKSRNDVSAKEQESWHMVTEGLNALIIDMKPAPF